MSRISPCLIVVLLIVLALVSLPLAVGVADEGKQSRVVIDSDGIHYKITISKLAPTVSIEAKNPTERDGEHTGYSILIDGQRVHDADFRLDQDETRTQKINITPGINVNQDEHTVTFSTYGNSTQFNFTRQINATDSGKIPTPYVSDVEVADGTINGEPSAVARVTLVNPSKQIYSTKLMVHTVGTDGSLYPASIRPESSRTITVELLDERGTEIAGEARLYTGNMTSKEGAMDQVEFVGQSGEQTEVWNVSYEPARPTWMDGHYRYENDSYAQSFGEKVSGGHEVGEVPAVYVAVTLLVGLVIVRKFR